LYGRLNVTAEAVLDRIFAVRNPVAFAYLVTSSIAKGEIRAMDLVAARR